MSKTAKKLLSVVLAVLVLAAGFSTTLGAFKPVSATTSTTVNYADEVSKVDGEKGLVFESNTNIIETSFYATVPESFKLYDVMGFGTNLDDENGYSGLRVEDYFFQHEGEKSIFSVGADREDIHPYITYEVEGGTSFSAEYLTYTESAWADLGLGDRAAELMLINILVSSDGLNFIPAKVENTLVNKGSYYLVKANIGNVGADTRYVKLQSNVNPTISNGKIEDALFIQKVTFFEPTTEAKAVGEVNLEFAGNKALKNGVEVSPVSSLFHSYAPKIGFGGSFGITTTGNDYGMYQGDGWEDLYAWGSIPEKDRTLYLTVKPGTRFQLEWSSWAGYANVAYALMAYNKAYNDKVEGYTDVYAEYETVEDFAWKVYTSSSTSGEWTEHKMVPYVGKATSFDAMSYDFIIPEGHCYVKIVDPIAGTCGTIMKTGANGYPMDYAKANAFAAGACGNDWAQLRSINYTPLKKDSDAVTKQYKDSNGLTYLNSNSATFNDEVGAYASGNIACLQNNASWTEDSVGGICVDGQGSGIGSTSKAYLVYNVEPGTTFSSEYRMTGSMKEKYITAGCKAEDFEFIFSAAATADGEYKEVARTITPSTGDTIGEVVFLVPSDARFIKVELPLTGLISGVTTHAAFIRNVTFVPGTAKKVSYNYKELSGSYCSLSGMTALKYTDKDFATVTGSVDSKYVILDGWTTNDKLGMWVDPTGFSTSATDFRERSYITYAVIPGTTFTATFSTIAADHFTKHPGETAESFKIRIYASESIDGKYNVIDSSLGGKRTVTVPDYARFIKVEFPQRSVSGDAGNHCVWYQNVSFTADMSIVPVSYDYSEMSENYISSSGSIKTNQLKSADATFGEVTGSVDSKYVILDGWVSGYKLGMWVDYTGFTTSATDFRERSYITYAVIPGTTFTATFNTMAGDHFTKHPGETAESFKIRIYASDKIDGEYEEIDSSLGGKRTVKVPEGKQFIKVEFPQRSVSGDAGNHCVYYQNVSFTADMSYVPVSYDYKELSAPYCSRESMTALNYTDKDFASITGSVDSKYVILDGWTTNDKLGMWVDTTGFENGTREERSYITYAVIPGTEFTATFSAIATDHYAKHPGETADSFKVRIYASDKIDSGYEEIDVSMGGKRTVKVPEGKRFIKVEFPQRNASGDAGNHCVFYQGVSFVKPDKGVNESIFADPDLNDYAAKDEVVLDKEVKTAYEIYDFADVIGTANGLAANADGAYVTYKVGNKEALVIKTENELDFEVSYDGKKFVDAELHACGGAYTVNVLEGKQYVRVNLDAGETITAAKVDGLNPTATFVNYAGTKVEVELDTYGATPAEPAIKDRVGYTFTKWNNPVGALWLDADFKAEYEKKTAEEDLFTVKLYDKAGNATITYPENITETTVRFDDRITVQADATHEGFVFDRWVDAATNKTISNSHKFSFLASGDLTIKAVYEESKTEIKPEDYIYNNANAIITSNEGETKWNMSVVWRVNIPAGSEVTETGILFSTGDLSLDADCEAVISSGNTPTIVKFDHSNPAAGKTLMFTVTGIKEGATRYARPYAIVDGEPVFGSVVVAPVTAE